MAFWAADDRLDFALGPDEGVNAGWGFEGLEGGNQDLWVATEYLCLCPAAPDGWCRDSWFADLEATSNQRRQQRASSTHAQFSFEQNRSPSPVHAGYPSWMTGDSPSPTRAYGASQPPTRPVAASASTPVPPRATLASRPDRSRLPPSPADDARPPRPAPNYSTNWLDPTEARRPARTPYIPRPLVSLEPASDSSISSPSTADEPPDYGVDIDDLLADQDEAAMPPTTRGAPRQQPRSSVVDLTHDPSSPPRPAGTSSRKRSADGSPRDRASGKRARRTSHPSPPPSPAVEELDLTNEAPSAEEELRQATQAAAIAAQQSAAADSDAPLRVGQRTCIICMEPYTNATVTACGHIYCHECLTQALMAGEKNSERGVGNCPVCRKPVNRKKDKNMIPVAFMQRSAFKGKGRRGSGGV